MREIVDGPHRDDPVQGEWQSGSWIIRQTGLAFGYEYSGDGLPNDQDTKDKLAIMNEINVACLLSTPDPMTGEGLLELPMRVKEKLNKYLKGAVG